MNPISQKNTKMKPDEIRVEKLANGYVLKTCGYDVNEKKVYVESLLKSPMIMKSLFNGDTPSRDKVEVEVELAEPVKKAQEEEKEYKEKNVLSKKEESDWLNEK